MLGRASSQVRAHTWAVLARGQSLFLVLCINESPQQLSEVGAIIGSILQKKKLSCTSLSHRSKVTNSPLWGVVKRRLQAAVAFCSLE